MTPATPSFLALPYQAFLHNQETLLYYCDMRKIIKPMGRLSTGPSCGIQGCHESVLAKHEKGVHPLNPPGSLSKHKICLFLL
ncbi:hypothetical protein NECAME_10555 [Necator americanus]|uniref:Uncharacterized protein n=1 Tax=Necator americanus TaxID=51031 RepID=W2TAT7_NECAM|nr:hypothetical protein NECAME_10555 [Necator americanus]ETN78132.1 hypothetical protein NECAME_10555 [Necator americanus]